jgi:hypothetical protein
VALPLLTSGGHSISIVHLWTKATEFSLVLVEPQTVLLYSVKKGVDFILLAIITATLSAVTAEAKVY